MEKKQGNGRLSDLRILTNVVELHGYPSCPPSLYLPNDTRFFSQVFNRSLVVRHFIMGAAHMA